MAIDLAALGARLREHGLTERAVRACFGVDCVGHAPLRAQRLGDDAPAPPGAIALHLLVGGRSLPEGAVRARLGDDLDRLVEIGAVAVTGGRARATVTVLPVGESLAVSGRADEEPGPGGVAFPDDSAFHLLGALPRRRVGRWLDVGTGNAILPLAARRLAAHIVATDVYAPAIEMARLGAALSGADLELAVADLCAAGRGESWDVITFNAPIPLAAETGAPPTHYYRPASDDILARIWRQAPPLVADSGELLVHSWLPGGEPPPAVPPGRVTVARYTPADAPAAFGVTSWRPGAASVRVLDVALSDEAPHLTRDDLL